MPSTGIFLTAKELARETAGGYDYIRTKDNVVRGLALIPSLNKYAPGIIPFGKGSRIVARARLFLKSQVTVPAYIKHKSNKWEYCGQYRAVEILEDAESIKQYSGGRKNPVGGILKTLRVDGPEIEVSGGGFPDPKTRKEIELAAIKFVSDILYKRGYEVEDHQKENRGYDLLASSPTGRLLVEVKGTDSPIPRFFLSRNEFLKSADMEWRLFVVCCARSQPILHEYTSEEMKKLYEFSPLAWECDLL